LNWPAIEGFFLGIYNIIMDKIVPWIMDKLVPAFDEIKKWIDDNKPLIDEFFGSLANIVEQVVDGLFGVGKEDQRAGMSGFLDKLETVMQWVIDNKDQIAAFVEMWVRFSVYAEILKTTLSIVLTIVQGIVSLMPIALLTRLATGAFSNVPGTDSYGRTIDTYSNTISGRPISSNSSSSVQNNQYTLVVNSQANSENVASDFQTLIGYHDR
jgi:hypothetical protein